MARIVAYLGPPLGLDALVLGTDGGLAEVAASADDGRSHGDGYGVGWYDLGARPEPAVYRRDVPVWGDRNLPTFADLVQSSAVLAAARRARDGEAVEESGSPPLAAGQWLFAMDGAPAGFGVHGPAFTRELSDARLAGLRGGLVDDLVFAMVLDRLDAGAAPADALRGVVEHVSRRVPAPLTLVLMDGEHIVATVAGPPLYHLRRKEAVFLTSAPAGVPIGWERVGDGMIVEADAQTTRISVL